LKARRRSNCENRSLVDDPITTATDGRGHLVMQWT
jgi:hypothetical protein